MAMDARTDQDVALGIQALDISPTVSLPSDIITVIAEHLAGLSAFGSLASLNVANHETRDVTLPVMYETLLLDRMNRDALAKLLETQDLPERFRHTKYITCTDDGRMCLNYSSHYRQRLLRLFPNLVMIIRTAPKYHMGLPRSGGVDLFRPMTASAMLQVVYRTPVVHPRNLGIRPIRSINGIWISRDGRLIAEPDVEMPMFLRAGVGMTITGGDTHIEGYTATDIAGLTATVLQVLKIGGREYADPQSGWTSHFGPHLEVLLTSDALESFVEQWSRFASSDPRALLPRLKICIREELPVTRSREILDAMRLTYIDHLNVFSHISLPEGAKYSVVQLEVTGKDGIDDDAGRGKHEAMLQIWKEGEEVRMGVDVEVEEEEEDEWDE